MAVLGGCEGEKRTPIPRDVKCPKCGEELEVFMKDGKTAEEVICEKCGYKIEEGTQI